MGDRARGGIVTFQDDVDLVVDVLGVAVVVDDTVSERLAEVRETKDSKRAPGDLVVDTDGAGPKL